MARILIVDDSPTETFRFREILTKHGYEVLKRPMERTVLPWRRQNCQIWSLWMW